MKEKLGIQWDGGRLLASQRILILVVTNQQDSQLSQVLRRQDGGRGAFFVFTGVLGIPGKIICVYDP